MMSMRNQCPIHIKKTALTIFPPHIHSGQSNLMLKSNGYLVAHVRPAKHGRFCYEYELRDSNNGWNGVYLIYYDAQGRVSSTNLTRTNHTLQNVPTGVTTTHKTAPVVTTPVVSAAAVM